MFMYFTCNSASVRLFVYDVWGGGCAGGFGCLWVMRYIRAGAAGDPVERGGAMCGRGWWLVGVLMGYG